MMMNKITIIAASCLMVFSSLSFAASATDVTKNWTCKTNASSSDVAADKAADDKMANSKTSAMAAYTFAAQNCRDCTKITCEVND